MRRFMRNFMKGTNWVLAGFLGLLGFIGCGKDEPKDEYGVPMAYYGIRYGEYVSSEFSDGGNDVLPQTESTGNQKKRRNEKVQ